MTAIHILEIALFAVGILLGRYSIHPGDDINRAYKSGWSAGTDFAKTEIRAVAREVVEELERREVLVYRREKR